MVTIDTGNPATNVIPAECRSAVNIRFNDLHTGAGLTDWLHGEADRVAEAFGVKIDMRVKVSGEAFLTPPGPLSDLVAQAVEAETGVTPRSPPPAARRTPASSRRIARWWNSGWSAAPCIRWTNALNWRISIS